MFAAWIKPFFEVRIINFIDLLKLSFYVKTLISYERLAVTGWFAYDDEA